MKSNLESKLSTDLLALTDYKMVIEKKLCPVHRLKARVAVKDNGVVTLSCSCPGFKRQCYYLLKKLSNIK